jgi:hypothetical protein
MTDSLTDATPADLRALAERAGVVKTDALFDYDYDHVDPMTTQHLMTALAHLDAAKAALIMASLRETERLKK